MIKVDVKQWYDQDAAVESVVAIESPDPFSPLINGFDLLLLVVSEQPNPTRTVHYIKNGLHIQEYRVDYPKLEQLILAADTSYVIEWILQGKIYLDRRRQMEKLRDALVVFPQYMREQKLLIEFSLFLRRFLQSKHYLEQGNGLDAYANIMEALFHWARIVITEAGSHPEVTVWKQVRVINGGVYKLYEELTSSNESVEQRVRLVLLACDFSVLSKMDKCCALLIRVLESRSIPWSPMELLEHPEISGLNIELSLLLKRLSMRSLIREVAVPEDGRPHSFCIKYTGAS